MPFRTRCIGVSLRGEVCVTEAERLARERYEDIAKQIEREDALINQRTSWLIFGEAFIVAGVATLAAKAADAGTRAVAVAPILAGAASLMLLAALFAQRCSRALRAAQEQLAYLQLTWRHSKYMQEHYVRPFGGTFEHAKGLHYPIWFAGAFCVFGWIAFSALAVASVLVSIHWDGSSVGPVVAALLSFLPAAALGHLSGTEMAKTRRENQSLSSHDPITELAADDGSRASRTD